MVNIVVTPISMTTRDAKGWTRVYKYNLAGDNSDVNYYQDIATKSQTLEAAILGLTNAVESRSFPTAGQQGRQDLAYGTNAQYPANWMTARMMFVTAAGSKSVFSIGAPEVAIFDTDGVTVLNDGTQALVVAYVNAVKNVQGTVYVSDIGAAPYTHFVGGILLFKRQPRRFNEFIKSSHLIQGEGE